MPSSPDKNAPPAPKEATGPPPTESREVRLRRKYPRLARLFDEIDRKKNGKLELQEVRAFLSRQPSSQSAELGSADAENIPDDAVEQAVDHLDRDGDGMISFPELVGQFKHLEQNDAANLGASVREAWLRGARLSSAFSDDTVMQVTSPRLWEAFAAGATGGLASRTATAPIDRVRILQQTWSLWPTSKGGAVQGPGLLSTARGVLRREGWTGFWRGNGTNMAKVVPQAAIVCTVYTQLLDTFGVADLHDRPYLRFAAGATSGIVAATVTFPLDQPKAGAPRVPWHERPTALRATLDAVATRTVSASDSATRQYRGFADAFGSILRNEGPSGFFKGIYATIVSLAIFVGVQQAGYDLILPHVGHAVDEAAWATTAAVAAGVRRVRQVARLPGGMPAGNVTGGDAPTAGARRKFGSRPTFWHSVIAGGIIGMSAQTIIHPLDTLRRRIQVTRSEWVLPTEAFRRVMASEGVSGLYRGLLAANLKVAPAVAITLASRDAVLGRLEWR